MENVRGDTENKEKSKRKKVRRGKSRKNVLTRFKFLMNNVRGLKSKITTTKRIIEEEKPVMVALIETNLNEGEKIELPGYKIARLDREEEGGGVIIAFKETLSNIWICTREYKKHGCEMVWVKLNNTKVKIKIGVIYMPQESRTKLDILKEIYTDIEIEVQEAVESGHSLLILGDLNCKIGEIIKGNTKEITKGGRLLNKMIKRNKLSVGNAQDICEGLWTRIEGQQKSVIDYVIMLEEDLGLLKQLEVDETKEITPYHIDDGKKKYSDHCTIVGTLNITMLENTQPKYVKVMGKNGWAKFREEIEKRQISNMIDNRCIKTSYTEWNNTILNIRDSCSKKVKMKRMWKVNRKLTVKKKSITRELKKTANRDEIEILKKRREVIISQIEEEEQKQEFNRINKVVEDVKKAGGVNSNTFWEVRKRICNKSEEPAHTIVNKNGKLCEDPEEIKLVYSEWYQNLLKTKDGETEMEKEAEEIVEQLWNSMEAIAESQPARKTTLEEVEKVVNKLDIKKAKDSANWKNTIMKEGGKEMIKSLQRITDQVDEQRVIPDEWQDMEVKVTHKKGEKVFMSNKRGCS